MDYLSANHEKIACAMLDRRRRPWGIVAIVVVALLADTVAWVLACRRLQNNATSADTGWVLAADPARWSGWPVAAAVTFPRATLRSGPGTLPPLVWTAGSLTVRLNLWQPTTLAIEAAGPQAVAVGAQPPLPFAATSLTAAIDLLGRAAPQLHAQALVVEAAGQRLRIGTAALRLPPDGWAADLTGIDWPGLTPPVATLRFGGHVAPAITPEPTAAETADAWRARGGRLALELIDLRWGTLAATATATLSLDPALQPAVDGSFSTSGLPAAVARLTDIGVVSPAVGSAAGAMLAILAAPSGGGPVTLPVALHAGILSVARVPLLRLPPLRWD